MRPVTKIIIIVTLISVVIFDVVAVIVSPTSTVSNVLMTWSLKIQFIPLFFGVMVGHFFITRERVENRAWKYILLAGLYVTIGIVGTIVAYATGWAGVPIVSVALGVPLGAILWTQQRQ